jgi:8-oxo-dGTP pyrophosphatase MutT (NUDIX family)
MGAGASAKILQASRQRKQRQQVAAVCYRLRENGIEFLLVQTRGGRWIFPKGGVEPGLTHAQSAALEAFEEAGVHGRIEHVPFARYFRKPGTASAKLSKQSDARSLPEDAGVAAHLCEVSRLERPQESNRKPTWLSAEKAKRRLLKDRAPAFGDELARVVDRASLRIQRLHGARHASIAAQSRPHVDALQKIRFEAHPDGRLHDELRMALLGRYLLKAGASADIERPLLRLSSGLESPSGKTRNVTAIDSAKRANPKARRSLPAPTSSS